MNVRDDRADAPEDSGRDRDLRALLEELGSVNRPGRKTCEALGARPAITIATRSTHCGGTSRLNALPGWILRHERFGTYRGGSAGVQIQQRVPDPAVGQGEPWKRSNRSPRE